MTTQPEALRLADQLGARYSGFPSCDEAAAELRRLHAVNQELREALKATLPMLEYMAGGMTHAAWQTQKAQSVLNKTLAAIAKAEGQA